MRFSRDTFSARVWFLGCFKIRQFFFAPCRERTFAINHVWSKVCFFFSIGSIFCGFKIRIHNSCTYKFPKGRTCKKINSHDRRSWLASAKSESYVLTFHPFALIFDAAIFVSRRSNKKFSLIWLPWKYFLFCKLSTLYPGYVLKKVHHGMRGFKEKEWNVLVSVTLMKGITGLKELRKNPE